MNTLKNIFKGLISNQAAIDNRKMKWYYTIIIFVLAVFLPWIPSLTSGYKSNGGAVFKSTNYEVTTALKHIFAEEDYFKNITIMKDSTTGSYYLDMNLDSDAATTDSSSWSDETLGTNTKALFTDTYNDQANQGASAYVSNPTGIAKTYYYDCVSVDTYDSKENTSETVSDSSSSSGNTGTSVHRVYLEMYYFPTLSRFDTKYNQYLSNFTNTVILNKDKNGVNNNVPHSYAFLLKDYIEVYFYPFTATVDTTSASGSYYGKLDEGFAYYGATSGATFYNYLTDNGTLSINEAYDNTFVNLADKSARSYTIYSTWMNIMMLTVATVGTLLVCSVLVIIFFKKKASLYRDSNFFHAINTVVTMSTTPAIIAMALGFMSSSYMLMAIIGANLIRAVFSMNKICPPSAPSDSKPVYQARD